ncbi:hypothetical protein PC116_g7449 [Phytophthora cactorum]|uniref:Uncharacterized protein n=1 Tax=Phytophthora cactorum TaxID=29920 RepID=A0A8T1D5E9_9STRA|nr:hypothetical protein PC112_g7770 [Phytophthora cactorum]KAG2832551.1 hypothetical protein PC111_g6556 [Phytophthora cactorum]KAG2863203.1 hypothetical protein PC113_g5649 [Phytophthora cactorum]KAG2920717.1 hypothetical protein PC114_g5985 [Phytophthora cactorum]KAG2935416.1 hypothetical protein PC115_g4902 [Phytophthora cactorum]
MPHYSSQYPNTSACSPTLDELTDTSNSPDYLTVKKRKPSYLVHKEENKTLKDQVLQLEAQVAVLKTRGMPAGLRPVAHDGGMRAQYSNPLCTRIICRKT